MTQLVDIFREITKSVSDRITPTLQAKNGEINGVFYQHGHILEVNETLIEQDKAPSQRANRYPLVILIQDFPETYQNGNVEYTLRILIVGQSSNEWKVNERYEKVFNPVLTPIYECLLKEIKRSGVFFWATDQAIPPHTKTDRPFKGVAVESGNVRYLMNDTLDAIEITNLRLKRDLCTC